MADEPRSGEGAPRWIKVLGLVALLLVLLAVAALVTGLAGPGGHGPARHLGGDPPGDATAPPGGVPQDHTVPSDIPDHEAEQP